jgi:hypothetical protein
MLQVDIDTVEAVRAQRTVRAARALAGVKHKVIDHQLTAAIKQFTQRHLAVGPFEYVRLGHLFPRQGTPLSTHCILCPQKFLLLGEKFLARLEPICFRYDFLFHRHIFDPLSRSNDYC